MRVLLDEPREGTDERRGGMNRWHRYQALQGKLTREMPSRSDAERRRALQELLDSQAAQRAIRADEQRRRVAGLGLTVAVAILAHAAVLLPLFALWVLSKPAPLETGERTAVRWVSLPSGSKMKGARLEAEQPKTPEPERKKEKKPDPEDEKPPGQIVTLPPSQDERPDHADHVAQSNHKTDRETVSRDQARDWTNPTHKRQDGLEQTQDRPTDAPKKPSRVAVPKGGRPGGPEGPGHAPSGNSGLDPDNGAGARDLALEIPKQEARQKLALRESEDGTAKNHDSQQEIESNSDRMRVSLGQTQNESQLPGDGSSNGSGQGLEGGTGDPGLPDLAALTPSLTELQQLAGMPANDYLPEVETDAETRLNAWRWKHSTFFDRLKKAISRNWRGAEVYQRYDPTREVYGTQRLVTVLHVTIDRSGNILELNVKEASGADFLDEEALRATRLAGPFPNPPEGLFGGADTYSFPFGFIITNEMRTIDFNWRPY